MPYKKSSSELTPADERLADVLSKTLDKSLDEIDAVSLQRLKHARVQALHEPTKMSRQWLPLSVAASVAALLLVPILVQQISGEKQTLDLAAQDIFSQEVPLSSQELDDLEMLMAMEDIDV